MWASPSPLDRRLAIQDGTPVNPMNILNAEGGYRNRAIGTGQEISVVENLTAPLAGTPQEHDSLGYSFWGTSNFAAATATNAKYLKVDGVDPIEDSYVTNGVLPTPSNNLLGNITFSHVNDGTYPVWSLLRLVSTSPAPAAVTALANAAQNFVANTTQPDFIPVSGLTKLHSHFTPPGITYPTTSTPANGAPAALPKLEAMWAESSSLPRLA